MSENSLIVRQKYISKLFEKVQGLQESVNLLERVDRKILKRNISDRSQYLEAIQTGGGSVNIKDLQGEALITRLKLEKQKADIQRARDTIAALNTNLSGITKSLVDLHNLMKDINDHIDFDPLGDASVPDLVAYDNQVLYNAFKNKEWANMVKVDSNPGDKIYDLLDKNFTQALGANQRNITESDYTDLLVRLHSPLRAPQNRPAGLAPSSPVAPANAGNAPPGSGPQVGGFFSNFFAPNKEETSVTSSEIPYNGQVMYSDTSFL